MRVNPRRAQPWQEQTEDMGFLNKLGIGIGAQTTSSSTSALPAQRNAHKSNGAAIAIGANRQPEMQEISRVSNGLKEFLWNLDGLGRYFRPYPIPRQNRYSVEVLHTFSSIIQD